MSVAWPDSIEDDVQAALDEALHAVFELTVPDPHERGEQTVSNSAEVEQAHDGRYLVRVLVAMPLQKYLDATDAGDNYVQADDHADNPGMAIFHTLQGHGIPIPIDDPRTGVLFDRETDSVEVQTLVDPADFGGDD